MYPENPEGTQVIVGSMNMRYISDTARNQTHNLFHPKWEPIPLGHSDRLSLQTIALDFLLQISRFYFLDLILLSNHLFTSNLQPWWSLYIDIE